MIHYRLQEEDHIILTPFEKNIEFWRQLWRVIERRYEQICIMPSFYYKLEFVANFLSNSSSKFLGD